MSSGLYLSKAGRDRLGEGIEAKMSVTEMSQKGLLEEHRFIIIIIQENPLNMVIKKKATSQQVFRMLIGS